MSYLFDLLAAAFYAAFAQNLIFSGGYGVSESIRMAAKPKKLWKISAAISVLSVLTATVCRLLDFIPAVKSAGMLAHAAVFVGAEFVIYSAACLSMRAIFQGERRKAAVKIIGIAAFNSLILAVPLINRKLNYNLYESVGFGIGAGAAFAVSVLLINAGMRRLESNEDIPEAFKGLPAIFIYVALLSMAFTGILGRAVSL
ncbi:MAG: hypothetical protein GX051_05655 [Clostridiales bacterium]|nr:hypothetical protein [Clostridiales bacterium]